MNETKGHDFLRRGLSQLPDNVLVKAILAKHAFRDCISQRVSQTLAEIEFIERQRDLLTEVHTAARETLATAESQLAMLTDIFDQRDLQDGKDDVAFYHAVYADELVAFTIAATQTEQLESFMDERSPSPDEHVEENPDHDDDTCGTLFTGLHSYVLVKNLYRVLKAFPRPPVGSNLNPSGNDMSTQLNLEGEQAVDPSFLHQGPGYLMTNPYPFNYQTPSMTEPHQLSSSTWADRLSAHAPPGGPSAGGYHTYQDTHPPASLLSSAQRYSNSLTNVIHTQGDQEISRPQCQRCVAMPPTPPPPASVGAVANATAPSDGYVADAALVPVTVTKQERGQIVDQAKKEVQKYMFAVDAVPTKNVRAECVKAAIQKATRAVIGGDNDVIGAMTAICRSFKQYTFCRVQRDYGLRLPLGSVHSEVDHKNVQVRQLLAELTFLKPWHYQPMQPTEDPYTATNEGLFECELFTDIIIDILFLSPGQLYKAINKDSMDPLCALAGTAIYAALKDHRNGVISKLWASAVESARLSEMQRAIIERGYILIDVQ
ncbi:hypothetical protein BKA82DRAFT_10154 [Pisolithus tinctorius]|uniref:DUF6532 domain-containing protein n=1 Tax=Pisolithus tinctorius Marx 270 TaxID=870435 RepID=A0A0C3NHY4_PISTI|nr:hypothetical protein BKA82DRAFT_10154 [Pisolithus tinctorius]KIO00625.1 hypothetical protein M404DRAFT_10154 [Pisolithus tinctorius Marx 270]